MNGDEFLLRREDTKDWVRFVVTSWSPTVNGATNGWETTKDTNTYEQNHPNWALGQLYNKQGVAISGYVYFNGCALSQGCLLYGGDSVGFGSNLNWLDKSGAYGGAWAGGGVKFYWGTGTEVI